ncbi:SAM-dependent methyltransferase [Methylohalobius crimeensis]|uniref:SAM-dependent methyltransferase n=1 Tax=Methylohalobius crimeensis TaxID=244365 RepID=UPI0003B7BA6E|nr:cyclopropane-fatty-acyl-phospholipid synthase family protein [Methylohalobius crimeensis]
MTVSIQRPPALIDKLFLKRLQNISKGTLEIELASGYREQLRGNEGMPEASWKIHRPMQLLGKVALKGAMGLGESYLDGDWDSPDLFALLSLLALNERELGGEGTGLAGGIDRLRHLFNVNTKTGARRNIQAHYDLGNEFYRLWLDETWSYSAARFASPSDSLAVAQRRKYRMHLAAIDAEPGQAVLEIGCGWGGFGLEAAAHGLRVTGITLSPAQLTLARERVHKAGVSDYVRLELQDYRDLTGTFDHIVSIEMLEAVGEGYWPTYFETLARVLKPGGRASIQVITIDHHYFETYRRQADFIQRHVFPGGMLPSVPVFEKQAETAGLQVAHRHTFGADYARTLRHWRARFLNQEELCLALGCNPRFLRLWHYYLAYCYAGFVTGRVDVNHFVLTRP